MTSGLSAASAGTITNRQTTRNTAGANRFMAEIPPGKEYKLVGPSQGTTPANGFRGTVRLSRERLYPPRQSSLTVLSGAQIEPVLLRKWPSVRDRKAAEEE